MSRKFQISLVVATALVVLSSPTVADISYRDSLRAYLSDLPNDGSLKEVVEKARGWLGALGPVFDLQPEVIRMHLSLMNPLDAHDGNLCGGQWNEFRNSLEQLYIELCSQDTDESDLLHRVVLEAHESYRRECRVANLLELKQIESDLQEEEIRMVNWMAQEVLQLKGKYIRKYVGVDLFNYKVKHTALAQVAYKILSELKDEPTVKYFNRRTVPKLTMAIPKDELISLYDRLVFKPCKNYLQAMEPTLNAVRGVEKYADEYFEICEFTRMSILKHNTCAGITGKYARAIYEWFQQWVSNVTKLEVKTSLKNSFKKKKPDRYRVRISADEIEEWAKMMPV